MIGDLQQLAPVVKETEWNMLNHYYDTSYFFGSLALKKNHLRHHRAKTSLPPKRSLFPFPTEQSPGE